MTEAPERRLAARSGVLLLWLLLSAAACDEVVPGAARPTIEVDGETIALEPGVSLHEVRLGGPGGDPLEPDTVRARPGDVVRFVAADARTYAVAFDRAALDPRAAAFLEQRGQLRGPPLVHEGAAWIITLEGAPPGAYPFELAGGERGLLIVEAAE